VYGTLSTGDYFGDLTLLLKERRSASVRSVGFSEAFQLDAASYERIRSDYPELREVLTKSSSERSSTLTDLVLEGVVL
jgi:voltage-gated potassium channel